MTRRCHQSDLLIRFQARFFIILLLGSASLLSNALFLSNPFRFESAINFYSFFSSYAKQLSTDQQRLQFMVILQGLLFGELKFDQTFLQNLYQSEVERYND